MKRLLVAMTAVIGVLTVGSSALTVSAGGASGG